MPLPRGIFYVLAANGYGAGKIILTETSCESFDSWDRLRVAGSKLTKLAQLALELEKTK
jgi:hypothetical protein